MTIPQNVKHTQNFKVSSTFNPSHARPKLFTIIKLIVSVKCCLISDPLSVLLS